MGDATPASDLHLLDLTLREGEQRPGVRYSVEQKVEAVREMDSLGLDYVQVGFPVADDRTKRVCEQADTDAALTGIARGIPGDVDAALDAGVDVVDLFVPTSDRQLEQVLGKPRETMVEAAIEATDRAADAGAEVHLSAMDGFRTDPDDVAALFDACEAEWYTVADTVGARTPAGVTEFLSDLDAAGEFGLDTVGVHFHDDLGVSTANTLAAARAGVGKADVSMGGIGERAGNTSLEEVAAAATVGDEDVAVAVNPADLIPVADRVLETLGEDVEPNKALLGEGVFAHESGLHTAAMLDDPATFEPFDPAQFGGERRLLFGGDSGRGAARGLLVRADRAPTDERVAALLDELAAADEDLSVDEAIALARRL
jgi:isopropylmalate/homocitrate/citramalate synthase